MPPASLLRRMERQRREHEQMAWRSPAVCGAEDQAGLHGREPLTEEIKPHGFQDKLALKKGVTSGKSSEESKINSRSARPGGTQRIPGEVQPGQAETSRAHLTQLSPPGRLRRAGKSPGHSVGPGQRGGLSPRSPELVGMFSYLTQPRCLQTHHFWEAREDGQGRGFRGSLEAWRQTDWEDRLVQRLTEEADVAATRSPHSPRIKSPVLWYNFFLTPRECWLLPPRMRSPCIGLSLRIVTLTAVGGMGRGRGMT